MSACEGDVPRPKPRTKRIMTDSLISTPPPALERSYSPTGRSSPAPVPRKRTGSQTSGSQHFFPENSVENDDLRKQVESLKVRVEELQKQEKYLKSKLLEREQKQSSRSIEREESLEMRERKLGIEREEFESKVVEQKFLDQQRESQLQRLQDELHVKKKALEHREFDLRAGMGVDEDREAELRQREERLAVREEELDSLARRLSERERRLDTREAELQQLQRRYLEQQQVMPASPKTPASATKQPQSPYGKLPEPMQFPRMKSSTPVATATTVANTSPTVSSQGHSATGFGSTAQSKLNVDHELAMQMTKVEEREAKREDSGGLDCSHDRDLAIQLQKELEGLDLEAEAALALQLQMEEEYGTVSDFGDTNISQMTQNLKDKYTEAVRRSEQERRDREIAQQLETAGTSEELNNLG